MNALQDSKKELAYVFLVHVYSDNIHVDLYFNYGKGHQQKCYVVLVTCVHACVHACVVHACVTVCVCVVRSIY